LTSIYTLSFSNPITIDRPAPKRQLQRILLDCLLQGLSQILGDRKKPVRRAQSAYALVRPLVFVILPQLIGTGSLKKRGLVMVLHRHGFDLFDETCLARTLRTVEGLDLISKKPF
jgi:hypothetical protein